MASPSNNAPGNNAPPWEEMANAIRTLQQDLATTRTTLVSANQEITQLRARIQEGGTGTSAKANKPNAFNGRNKSTVESWASCMDAYVTSEEPQRALVVAASYLEGDAHIWYTNYKKTENVTSWSQLRTALLARFSPLNKTLTARDKLSKWRQVKDVASFNSDFLQIILDIPDITEAEKVDRYCRGLKTHIWEALCTKEYQKVESVMTDALRVEAAKRGTRNMGNPYESSRPGSRGTPSSGTIADGPTPMELGSTNLVKLTPEERDRCFREGRCLRCREKGHLAKECPKARGQRTPSA